MRRDQSRLNQNPSVNVLLSCGAGACRTEYECVLIAHNRSYSTVQSDNDPASADDRVNLTEFYTVFYGVSSAGVSCRQRWPPPTIAAMTKLLGK